MTVLRETTAGNAKRYDGRGALAVLTGLAAAVLIAPLVSFGPAQAETDSPIQALLKYRKQAEWTAKFDSAVRGQVAIKSLTPTLSADTATYMEHAITLYKTIVANGGWPKVPADKVLKLGMKDPNVVKLRQRLMASGDLRQSTGLSDIYDSYVGLAVRRFQLRHGLEADGAAGRSTLTLMNIPAELRLKQLEVNLVRVRAMAGFLGERYAMVNLPAAEIEAVEAGRVRSRHTAIVGKIDRPSPLINSKIYEINFNPYWHVPVSIIRKDLIPLMKKEPNYLRDNKIRIYTEKGGEEIKPEDIDWNTDEATAYLFRQEPGHNNSMGNVRINFHNKHAVYMHDTPTKSVFGKDFRFESSGCVRVQNVREFVTWILQGTEDWNREKVDDIFRKGERLDVDVKNKVPIYWVYVTAWANAEGIVHFREDIYNRDGLSTNTALR